MRNITDYVKDVDLTFGEAGFSSVDSLILSQLSYLNFDGFVSQDFDEAVAVSIGEIANNPRCEELFKGSRDGARNIELFTAMALSPRFSDIRLTKFVYRFDENSEEQFCAVTYLIGEGTAYVAFRGTDSTFVGWKEDFNMAFRTPVPAQTRAKEYLEQVAENTGRELLVGGHSKGGNLAVYACVECKDDTRQRVWRIFNHDGPGFRDETLESANYALIQNRIEKTVPEFSIVGMLLEQKERYYVVKSSRMGLMQHDPFSWEVGADNSFVYADALTGSAVFMDKTLTEWLNAVDDEHRELFINSLYEVIRATGASKLSDLKHIGPAKALAALEAIKDIDDDTRTFVLKTIRLLFSFALRGLRSANVQFIGEVAPMIDAKLSALSRKRKER